MRYPYQYKSKVNLPIQWNRHALLKLLFTFHPVKSETKIKSLFVKISKFFPGKQQLVMKQPIKTNCQECFPYIQHVCRPWLVALYVMPVFTMSPVHNSCNSSNHSTPLFCQVKTWKSLSLFSTMSCVNTFLNVSIISCFIHDTFYGSGTLEEAWVEGVW